MTRNKSSSSKFILILGAFTSAVLIVGILYRVQNTEQDDLQIMAMVQPVTEAVIEVPVVPEATIPQPKPVVTPEPVATTPELPSLNNSDLFVRQQMLSIKHHANMESWLGHNDLIRRAASYFNGLARGAVLSKIFPLSPPEGHFITHRDGETIWLNAGNYERYHSTVAVFSSLDMQALAQLFHVTRPLLEKAFAEMGYRPRQMDGIIIQAIDNILATPIIVEPIQLTRESVAFKFADLELEALPPLQKQLLRIGPENTRRLQQQARALKEALLTP